MIIDCCIIFDNLVWVVNKTKFDYVGIEIDLDFKNLLYIVVHIIILFKFCDNFPLI